MVSSCWIRLRERERGKIKILDSRDRVTFNLYLQLFSSVSLLRFIQSHLQHNFVFVNPSRSLRKYFYAFAFRNSILLSLIRRVENGKLRTATNIDFRFRNHRSDIPSRLDTSIRFELFEALKCLMKGKWIFRVQLTLPAVITFETSNISPVLSPITIFTLV